MSDSAAESGGFCEVRGAIFPLVYADLIEAGLNEDAVGMRAAIYGSCCLAAVGVDAWKREIAASERREPR